MPDITMCRNSSCPARRTCYRYRAVPNPDWQSIAGFHGSDEDWSCYWPLTQATGPVLDTDEVDRIINDIALERQMDCERRDLYRLGHEWMEADRVREKENGHV